MFIGTVAICTQTSPSLSTEPAIGAWLFRVKKRNPKTRPIPRRLVETTSYKSRTKRRRPRSKSRTRTTIPLVITITIRMIIVRWEPWFWGVKERVVAPWTCNNWVGPSRSRDRSRSCCRRRRPSLRRRRRRRRSGRGSWRLGPRKRGWEGPGLRIFQTLLLLLPNRSLGIRSGGTSY